MDIENTTGEPNLSPGPSIGSVDKIETVSNTEPTPQATEEALSQSDVASTPVTDNTNQMDYSEEIEPKSQEAVEAAPEPIQQKPLPKPKPMVQPVIIADYEKLLSRFKASIAISKFDESLLTDDHFVLIKDFLQSQDARKLVIYMDDSKTPAALQVSTALPSQSFSEMAYFIKESSLKADSLNEFNFEHKVQFGKLTKNTMESLLRMMSHVYVPS